MFGILGIYSLHKLTQEQIYFTYFNKVVLEGNIYYEVLEGSFKKRGSYTLSKLGEHPLYIQQYYSSKIETGVKEKIEDNLIGVTNIVEQKKLLAVMVIYEDRFNRTHLIDPHQENPIKLKEKSVVKESYDFLKY